MIRNQIAFFFCILCLIAAAGFGAERAIFVRTAQQVTGAVTAVTAINDRCRARRGVYNDCTNFKATVSYQVPAGTTPYTIELSAGSVDGANQPVSRATYARNQPVKIAYNPANPGEAYEAGTGIWGKPLGCFLLGVIFFIMSLFDYWITRWF